MLLGILQCDSVLTELQGTFGDYPDMFRQLLATAEPAFEYRVYDLTKSNLPASVEECGQWLITGSKWSVYDDAAWIHHARNFVVSLHQARQPTVGICFGHQLIADALGGKVEKARQGWRVGVHTADILETPPWMKPAARRLALLFSHQDQVTSLPPEASILASHSLSPYDMLQIGDHMLTFQGHPEFSKAYSRTMMERRRKKLGEQTFKSGMASLTQRTHAEIAAQWIARFLDNAHRNAKPEI